MAKALVWFAQLLVVAVVLRATVAVEETQHATTTTSSSTLSDEHRAHLHQLNEMIMEQARLTEEEKEMRRALTIEELMEHDPSLLEVRVKTDVQAEQELEHEMKDFWTFDWCEACMAVWNNLFYRREAWFHSKGNVQGTYFDGVEQVMQTAGFGASRRSMGNSAMDKAYQSYMLSEDEGCSGVRVEARDNCQRLYHRMKKAIWVMQCLFDKKNKDSTENKVWKEWNDKKMIDKKFREMKEVNKWASSKFPKGDKRMKSHVRSYTLAAIMNYGCYEDRVWPRDNIPYEMCPARLACNCMFDHCGTFSGDVLPGRDCMLRIPTGSQAEEKVGSNWKLWSHHHREEAGGHPVHEEADESEHHQQHRREVHAEVFSNSWSATFQPPQKTN